MAKANLGKNEVVITQENGLEVVKNMLKPYYESKGYEIGWSDCHNLIGRPMKIFPIYYDKTDWICDEDIEFDYERTLRIDETEEIFNGELYVNQKRLYTEPPITLNTENESEVKHRLEIYFERNPFTENFGIESFCYGDGVRFLYVSFNNLGKYHYHSFPYGCKVGLFNSQLVYVEPSES